MLHQALWVLGLQTAVPRGAVRTAVPRGSVEPPRTDFAALHAQRDYHAEQLRLLDEQLTATPHTPAASSDDALVPMLGYLSKSAGDYQRDESAPPPSAWTLASNNFRRELPNLVGALLGSERTAVQDDERSYAESLQALTLDNAAIWARAHARPAVPAPWLIKAPYLFLCGQLDSLFEGRPIERCIVAVV
jgi:hypothetical protein